MLLVITTISTLVHIFSTAYMLGDPHIPRFMSYLSFFTFLMVVLVSSDNYLQFYWLGGGWSMLLSFNKFLIN